MKNSWHFTLFDTNWKCFQNARENSHAAKPISSTQGRPQNEITYNYFITTITPLDNNNRYYCVNFHIPWELLSRKAWAARTVGGTARLPVTFDVGREKKLHLHNRNGRWMKQWRRRPSRAFFPFQFRFRFCVACVCGKIRNEIRTRNSNNRPLSRTAYARKIYALSRTRWWIAN